MVTTGTPYPIGRQMALKNGFSQYDNILNIKYSS